MAERDVSTLRRIPYSGGTLLVQQGNGFRFF